MKKSAVFLLVVLFTGIATAQQPLYEKYHEPVTRGLKAANQTDFPRKIDWYGWESGAWALKATQTVEYNPSGYRLTELMDSLQGTDLKYQYTYNPDNRITEILILKLIAGGWVPESRSRHEYDSRGAESLMMIEGYVDGAWVAQMGFRKNREYTGDLLYRESTSLWDNSRQAFVNFWRFTYTYNSGVLESDINEIYTNGSWRYYFRERHFWATKDRHDYILFDSWNGFAWAPDVKETYRFYDEMSVEVVDSKWNAAAGDYSPLDRYTDEYDPHQNNVLFTWETMKQGAWVLMEGERYTFAYEGDHAASRISESTLADSLGNPQPWMKTTREVYSDFFNLGTDPIIAGVIGITCFPNPAGDQTVVKLTLPKAGTFRLVLYSISGQKVVDQNVSSNGTEIRYQLNVSDIPPGSYMLIASDEEGHELAKTRIIKQ